jgi:4-cresol dehydrogenase (hydroxylating) flavoprotein subunit
MSSSRVDTPINDISREEAFLSWRKILGADRVLQSEAAERIYGTCTGTERRRILGALIPQPKTDPETYEEISKIVKIAEHFSVSLYPISTGHNWGYGTSNPVVDGCMVLDLSRFNRIISFDSKLGVVTLEPGVTQAQLSEFFDQNNYPFLVPTTGAGPSCSIMANALEHGYGITPISDHFAAVTSIEAILADGSIYRPALTELGSGDVDRIFKWGLGPYIDGLFAQSGLGIVTRMTILLSKKPKSFCAFFFSVSSDSSLEKIVETVQDIMESLNGVVGSVNLMNQHRVLAMTVPYPKEKIGDNKLLPTEVIAELGRKNQIMAWTGVGALYGEPSIITAAKKIVRKKLTHVVSRMIFVSPAKMKVMNKIATLIPGNAGVYLRNVASKLESSLQIMLGSPNEVALHLAYWKSGHIQATGSPLDPARDGCGLVWYSPLVPMKSNLVRKYVSHVMQTCEDYGVEPLITLTAFSERCFGSSVPLLFNSQSEEEFIRIQKCYQVLFEDGISMGFAPYRLGLESMSKVTNTSTTFWNVVEKIKSSLDPKGIIAPGRYVQHK